jgi:hypothetical protein
MVLMDGQNSMPEERESIIAEGRWSRIRIGQIRVYIREPE